MGASAPNQDCFPTRGLFFRSLGTMRNARPRQYLKAASKRILLRLLLSFALQFHYSFPSAGCMRRSAPEPSFPFLEPKVCEGDQPSQYFFRAKTCVKPEKTVVLEAGNRLEETPAETRGGP